MPEANETKQFECDQDKPFFSWGNCGVLSIIVSSICAGSHQPPQFGFQFEFEI